MEAVGLVVMRWVQALPWEVLLGSVLAVGSVFTRWVHANSMMLCRSKCYLGFMVVVELLELDLVEVAFLPKAT